jgi:ABC-type multidrug transport system fused ATPase/permease subunit
MDYIFVFDQGKIVEEGTPTDLLKTKGYYAKLWGTQTRGLPYC